MWSISKPLLPGYLACVPLSCFPNGNTESIARVKKKREGSPSNLLRLALAMAMVTFRYFSSHFTDAFVRWHSTSEFAMIVLSKCALNCKHVSTTFFSDIPYSHSISVTISAMPWSGKGRAYAATGGGITWPGRERDIYIYTCNIII